MDRPLRSARVANFVYFALCGGLIGTWVVHIPAVEARVGISHAMLGSLLVLLGLGAFTGMRVAGRPGDRLGAHVVLPIGGVLAGATLALPGLSPDVWTLAGALLVFGFCNGCLDVSMNAHAVQVEKAYDRPIMSAFHAMFSVGGVVAALVGVGTASAGMSPPMGMATVGVVGIVIALVAARALLGTTPPAATTTTTATARSAATTAAVGDGGRAPAGQRRKPPGRIWILASLAAMVMLAEGAANDWSALHLKDVLGAPASTAAFAYGTYAAAMTTGRLLADRVSGRFGPMAVLRYGAATAAVGITIVSVTPWVWAAFAGWALFGLGLSGCVPQLYSATWRVDPSAAGVNISRVAGLGYLGMLSGPAVIGWLTHLVPLNHAFLLLTLLCAITATAAGVLRTGSGGAREVARSSHRPPVRHAP
ncbi:MFS transporter [Streptomyces sp. NPDC057307]|uniref:MFS transporter n=1 Tax=Streptomyces sp. NPDC057307 TaxID=3346096 RepID=UPI0036343DFE